MSLPKPDVLFAQAEIQARIATMGSEITRSFGGNGLCVVTLMKSCIVFMADLIRTVPLDMTCHFLRASALNNEAAVRTDIVYSTDIPYEGRHILLLDDIVDTGITLSFLVDHIRERRPASLKVACLIDKPGDRKIDVHPDWAAFTIAEPLDRFIVGYGLDYAENYRGLPYLGTIPRPSSKAAGPGANVSSGSE
jgi:hypoxanthine phosphoribosyltransferase